MFCHHQSHHYHQYLPDRKHQFHTVSDSSEDKPLHNPHPYISTQSPTDSSVVPVHPQRVSLQPNFTAPPEEEIGNVWRESMPSALFIYIDDPEKYGLEPGMPSDNGTERKAYGVTWTHEYHCLVMIPAVFLFCFSDNLMFAR